MKNDCREVPVFQLAGACSVSHAVAPHAPTARFPVAVRLFATVTSSRPIARSNVAQEPWVVE